MDHTDSTTLLARLQDVADPRSKLGQVSSWLPVEVSCGRIETAVSSRHEENT